MILDIILCVLLILITVMQYRRGAFLSLRGLLTTAGAGYLSLRFQSYGSAFLYEHVVRDRLVHTIKQDMLTGRALDPNYTWRAGVMKASEQTTNPQTLAEYVVDNTIRPAVYPVVELITTALLFLVFALLLFFLLRWIGRIFQSFTVLRGVDAVFGGVFGLAEGLVVVFLAAAVFAVLQDTDVITNDWLLSQMIQSKLVNFSKEFIFPYLNAWKLAL